MKYISLSSIDVYRKLNGKRLLTFGIIALLILASFTVIAVRPASASPEEPWWFVPGNYMMHVQPSSSRNITITIGLLNGTVGGKNLTLAPPASGVAYPVCDGYNVTFGTPENGLVPVTIPQASFISKPFYLRNITVGAFTTYTWGQLEAVADGNGTLDTVGGNLDVDMPVKVTGKDNGGYSSIVRTIGDGTKDPAGSLMIDMPLNLTVYIGTSPTNSTWQADLVEIKFPMWLTTGKTNVTITDPAPFPKGTDSLHGYKTSAQGSPVDPYNCSTIIVATGGGLDLYYELLGADLYNDFMFKEVMVATPNPPLIPPPPVGGISIPVDKLSLLAPYIALVSTIILAVSASVALIKYRKKQ